MIQLVKVRRQVLVSASAIALLGAAGVGAASISSGSLATPQAASTDPGYTGYCGVELADIKHLTDPAASSINFTPQDATVAQLGAIPAPSHAPSTRTAQEKVVYRLNVHLQKAKLEDDSDIHLVIDDGAGHSMISELPAAQCESGAVHESDIDQARADFVHACGLPGSSSFSTLGGNATLTGVFFFDVPHGQTGAAPNYAELHPLLSFSTSNCFVPGPPTTTASTTTTTTATTTTATTTAATTTTVATPPPTRCVVPNVKGLALVGARSRVVRASCSLGRITHAYSRRIRRGRVIAQRPGPGTVWPHGTSVRLTISRGRK
jgi:hypothetical protein